MTSRVYEKLSLKALKARYKKVTGEDYKGLTRLQMEKVLFPMVEDKKEIVKPEPPKKKVHPIRGKVKCRALKDWVGSYGKLSARLTRGKEYRLEKNLYLYLKAYKVVA